MRRYVSLNLVRTLLLVAVAGMAFLAPAAAQTSDATTAGTGSVLTYHGDTLRTGWNRKETALTTANVNSASFGLLATVSLDDQVDAQPLVAANQQFNGSAPGVYDVAYVATENDSVYAIDSATGNVLGSRNLGTPVPAQCNNNGPNVGITSTPTIDRGKNALYLITYTLESGTPVYRLHALDTRTLLDKVPSVVVAASHTISNGGTASLSAATSRQRAALLESKGVIYAGFSSFCDAAQTTARGWVLGWQAATLAPLPSNDLTDTLATSPNDYYLDSVWMSGAGLAADESGSVYFITSNSDKASYDGVHDIQESFVRERADLLTLQGIFTPSNEAQLDADDFDYGSGGVLLLPYLKNSVVHRIGAAAGKDGNLYVVDRDALGGHSASGNNVLGTYGIGNCWCAPAYFVGSDNVPRIVTSGGTHLNVWKVQTTPSVALVFESSSASLPTGQDAGFFTTVSSNATTAGSAIVWAALRPTDFNNPVITLAAFDASNASHELFSAVAGSWPATTGNANVVPVVAGGRVLVATAKQLAIFGLLPAGGSARAAARVALSPRPLPASVHEVYGRIEAVAGTRLSLRTRTGRVLAIDLTAAKRADRTADLFVGSLAFVRLTVAPSGALMAQAVQRAKSPALWGPDR